MRFFARTRWLWSLLLTIAWCAIPPRVCPGQQSLAWDWRPQDCFRIVTTQDVAMIAEVGEKSVRMSHRTAVQVAWQVTEVDSDGTAEIKHSVERMKIRLKSPAADDVVYDSAANETAAGPAKQLAAAVDPLLKTGATMKISPTGQVTDVRLSENAEALPKKNTGAAQAFSRFFTQAGVVELTGLTQLALPERPVAVGDRWDRAGETETGLGSFARKTTYERIDDETRDNRKLARISLTGTLTPVEPSEPRLPGEPDRPAAVRIEEQDIRGTILFDKAAGHPVEAVFQQRLTIAGKADNQDVTQQVASDVRVRITKLPPAE